MSKMICVLALALALPALAEAPATPSAPAATAHIPTAKLKDIHRLLDISGASARGSQVFHLVLQSVKNQHPDVPEKFWSEMEKEFKGEGLVQLLIPIYNRHFTDGEIKQLIAFYESPIGRKLLQEQPAVIRESMTAGRSYGMKIAQTVVTKLASFKK